MTADPTPLRTQSTAKSHSKLPARQPKPTGIPDSSWISAHFRLLSFWFYEVKKRADPFWTVQPGHVEIARTDTLQDPTPSKQSPLAQNQSQYHTLPAAFFFLSFSSNINFSHHSLNIFQRPSFSFPVFILHFQSFPSDSKKLLMSYLPPNKLPLRLLRQLKVSGSFSFLLEARNHLLLGSDQSLDIDLDLDLMHFIDLNAPVNCGKLQLGHDMSRICPTGERAKLSFKHG